MTKLYSDLSLTGSNLVDNDAISASIHNILSTKKGERMFDRRFGSNLEEFLFDPYSFSTSRFIFADIRESLGAEPRIELLEASTVDLDPGSRTYKITLQLKVKATGDIIQIKKDLSAK